MPFEAAKCPTCGATIQVQSDSDSAFCSSCGNKLEPKKAIAEYKLEVEIIKPVPVKGVSSVENDLLRGKQCLEAKDWQKAYLVFGTAVDKQADCYEAWHGCLSAMTQNFSWLNDSIANIDGEKGLSAVVRNSMKYCDATQCDAIKIKLEMLYNSLADEYNNSLTEISSKKSKKTICAFSIVLSAVSFTGFFIYNMYNIFANLQSVNGMGLISFIALIGFIIARRNYRKSQRELEAIYNYEFRNRLNVIKSAMR